jgi:hypothetical protein
VFFENALPNLTGSVILSEAVLGIGDLEYANDHRVDNFFVGEFAWDPVIVPQASTIGLSKRDKELQVSKFPSRVVYKELRVFSILRSLLRIVEGCRQAKAILSVPCSIKTDA